MTPRPFRSLLLIGMLVVPLGVGAAPPAPKKSGGAKPADAAAAASGPSKADMLKAASAAAADKRKSLMGEGTVKREETKAAPSKADSAQKKAKKGSSADSKRNRQIIEDNKKTLALALKARPIDVDEVAEYLFRLAEQCSDEADYVFASIEGPAHQKAMDKWFACRKEKGDKACGDEPRPEYTESDKWRNDAFSYYKRLIDEYPKYERRIGVLTNFAVSKYEYSFQFSNSDSDDSKKDDKRAIKAREEGVQLYQQLVKEFPKSPKAASAYVRIGDHFFEANKEPAARDNYEKALALKDPSTSIRALYKLAWCDINREEMNDALDRFREVVTRSEEAIKSKKKGAVDLRKDALRDMAKAYVALDIRDPAIKFYEEHAAEDVPKHIKRLAEGASDAGRLETARFFYAWLLKNKPTDKSAPDWQNAVVDMLGKQNKKPEMRAAILELADTYGPDSNWYRANRSDADAIRRATQLAEESMYTVVVETHQEAMKSKACNTYNETRDLYRKFLERFAQSDKTYAMRYFYGDILFALEDYQGALEQYEKTIADKDHKDYLKDAATNLLVAADKLVEIEAGRYTRKPCEGGSIDEEGSKATTAAAKVAKKSKDEVASGKRDLNDAERRLLKACDRFLEVVPDSPEEAKVRLRAAAIYYDKGHYKEATDRFKEIISKWPKDTNSGLAAQLMLDTLETAEEWETLVQLARDFLANKELMAGKDEFKSRLEGLYVQGSLYKIAMATEKANPAKATKLFLDFVSEFPKSSYAPIALAKAFELQRSAEQLGAALTTAERLLKEYKDCDSGTWLKLPNGEERTVKLLPAITLAIPNIQLQMGDFAGAAAGFERYAAANKDSPDAPSALVTAGYWYEALEPAKAAAAYKAYIDIFKSGKRDEEIKKRELPTPVQLSLAQARAAEAAGNPSEVIARYRQYLAEHGATIGKGQVLSALYKQLQSVPRLPKAEQAKIDTNKLCSQIIAEFEAASDADKALPGSKAGYAQCQFNRLEPRYKEYEAIKFANAAKFAADFARKTALAEELGGAYQRIVDVGDDDWTMAALVRRALIPKLFGKALLEAPIPKGLDAEQEEMYRGQIEEKASEFDEPATQAIEAAVKEAFDGKVYNEWTLKAQELMMEYRKDAFGEIKTRQTRGADTFRTPANCK